MGESCWGGAGGNWPRQNERVDVSVVRQVDALHCGPACAEMLLRKRGILHVDQQAIGSVCGVPVWPTSLAQTMQQLASASGQWTGGWAVGTGLTPQAVFEILCATGAWAAMLWTPGERIGHMVVVDGLEQTGAVCVRDPWPPGTTYTMSRRDFLDYWTEQAIFWRA